MEQITKKPPVIQRRFAAKLEDPHTRTRRWATVALLTWDPEDESKAQAVCEWLRDKIQRGEVHPPTVDGIFKELLNQCSKHFYNQYWAQRPQQIVSMNDTTPPPNVYLLMAILMREKLWVVQVGVGYVYLFKNEREQKPYRVAPDPTQKSATISEEIGIGFYPKVAFDMELSPPYQAQDTNLKLEWGDKIGLSTHSDIASIQQCESVLAYSLRGWFRQILDIIDYVWRRLGQSIGKWFLIALIICTIIFVLYSVYKLVALFDYPYLDSVKSTVNYYQNVPAVKFTTCLPKLLPFAATITTRPFTNCRTPTSLTKAPANHQARTSTATPSPNALSTPTEIKTTQAVANANVPSYSTAVPVLPPTETPIPTIAPAMTPTLTPTLTPTATLTSTPFPLLITITGPENNVTANKGIGFSLEFQWTTNISLPAGQGYQIIARREGWRSDQWIGLDAPITTTNTRIDLSGITVNQTNYLESGHYAWEVCAVQINPYKLLDMCSMTERFFWYERP